MKTIKIAALLLFAVLAAPLASATTFATQPAFDTCSATETRGEAVQIDSATYTSLMDQGGVVVSAEEAQERAMRDCYQFYPLYSVDGELIGFVAVPVACGGGGGGGTRV